MEYRRKKVLPVLVCKWVGSKNMESYPHWVRERFLVDHNGAAAYMSSGEQVSEGEYIALEKGKVHILSEERLNELYEPTAIVAVETPTSERGLRLREINRLKGLIEVSRQNVRTLEKELLPGKIERLIESFEEIGGRSNLEYAKSLKELLSGEDSPYIPYPQEEFLEFCRKSNIPLGYDTRDEGDSYVGYTTYWSNFRLGN